MSVCPVDAWALGGHILVVDSCCPAGTALPHLHKCLTPLGPRPLPSCCRAPPVPPASAPHHLRSRWVSKAQVFQLHYLFSICPNSSFGRQQTSVPGGEQPGLSLQDL